MFFLKCGLFYIFIMFSLIIAVGAGVLSALRIFYEEKKKK